MIDADRLVREGERKLRAAGVDSPAHDAAVLLAHACGCRRADIDRARLLGSGLDGVVAPHDALRAYRSLIDRRAAREPLQLIVGYARFRGLIVDVGPGVFIPRPETEMMVQCGIDWLNDQPVEAPRVVDLCAGSGVIGLSVASEVADAEVWAVEMSPDALVWTERNRRRIGSISPCLDDSYHLVSGDATSPRTLAYLDGTVDAVITNPPYVPDARVPDQPEVRDHDPRMALYGGSDDGMAIPRLIIDRAHALLRPGGLLVMEHDITQGGRLAAYARDRGFPESRTVEDWTHRPRALMAVKG